MWKLPAGLNARGRRQDGKFPDCTNHEWNGSNVHSRPGTRTARKTEHGVKRSNTNELAADEPHSIMRYQACLLVEWPNGPETVHLTRGTHMSRMRINLLAVAVTLLGGAFYARPASAESPLLVLSATCGACSGTCCGFDSAGTCWASDRCAPIRL